MIHNDLAADERSNIINGRCIRSKCYVVPRNVESRIYNVVDITTLKSLYAAPRKI